MTNDQGQRRWVGLGVGTEKSNGGVPGTLTWEATR